MISADEIKSSLSMERVLERYGFEPNPQGYISCPFHAGDKSPSLKVYPGSRGWHCFGCGAGGTVIDFVMKLFDISFRQACLRIDTDFFGMPDAEIRVQRKREPTDGKITDNERYWAAKRIIAQEKDDDEFWDAVKAAAQLEIKRENEDLKRAEDLMRGTQNMRDTANTEDLLTRGTANAG